MHNNKYVEVITLCINDYGVICCTLNEALTLKYLMVHNHWINNEMEQLEELIIRKNTISCRDTKNLEICCVYISFWT